MNKILFFLTLFAFKAHAIELKVGALIGNNKPGISKTQYTEKFYEAILLAKIAYEKELKKKNITLTFKIYEMKDDPINNYFPIKKAISDKMDVLIGPSSSFYIPGIHLALKDSKTKLLVISPYSMSKLIRDSKNMVSMLDMNNDFNGMLNHFVNMKFQDKSFLTICAEDVEASKVHCGGLSQKFKNKKNYIATNKDISNIDQIVAQVLKDKPDFVITPNRIPISGVIIRELTKKGFRGTFIGSSALGEIKETGLLSVVGHDDFKAIALRQNSVHDLNYDSKYASTVKALTEAWGYPRLTSLLFYDAMAMVIEAILEGQNKFRQTIRKNNSYSGIISKKKKKRKIYKAIQIEKGIYSLLGRFSI